MTRSRKHNRYSWDGLSDCGASPCPSEASNGKTDHRKDCPHCNTAASESWEIERGILRKAIAVDMAAGARLRGKTRLWLQVGMLMSAFRTSCPQANCTSSRSCPTGIHFFRGFNPCSTPCSITTRALKLCTKFRKVLSLFQPTSCLRNTLSLPRALLQKPLLPGKDRLLQTLCSSTLTKSRNMVRRCLFIPLTFWRGG